MSSAGEAFAYVVPSKVAKTQNLYNSRSPHSTHGADKLLYYNSYVLPIVAFGYEGIESLAMASFEARDTGKTKRLIPLWIHGTIPVAYFFLTLGSVLTVDWQDPALPSSYNSGADSGAGRVGGSQGSCGGKSPPNSVVILGIFKGVNAFGQDEFRPCLGRGAINAAGVLNGILVFTTMSAASAALYVSSRTLYGLTYRESRTDGWVKRYFRWATGTVWTLTGAPAGAVVMSVVSWWWLIILDEARRGGIKPATDVSNDSPVLARGQTKYAWRGLY